MEQRTYLSIDIDYWLQHPNSDDCSNFFNIIRALNIKPMIVESHEQIVKHVNLSKCNCLINVDFHSDLADLSFKAQKENGKNDFNDGTWGNFISWQRNGTFIWVMPNRAACYNRSGGRCDTEKNPFEIKCTDWKKCIAKVGWREIDFLNVKAISIAASPDYTNYHTVTPARMMYPKLDK